MTANADGRDRDWAIGILERYRVALADMRDLPRWTNDDRYEECLGAANRLNPVAWQIVKDVLPGVAEYDHDLSDFTQISAQRSDVERALGVLELQHELSEHWPTEPSLVLNSTQLHPWAWIPAQELWEIGRYTEALQMAARTINARTQEKLGRTDLEFAPLARDAFSPNAPTVGSPRLRVVEPRDVDDETFKNYHLGAASLADYLFRRWRNITAHNEPDEIMPQAANEALGAMSIYARMVDHAVVVREVDGESQGPNA